MKLLTDWNDNLLEIYSYYNKLILADNENGNHFGGFKVWYSPIIIKPKILIIGINPGKNEATIEKRINIEAATIFEYLPDKKDYYLANQVKKAFEMAGKSQILNHETIKTNFYHLITNNQRQLTLLNRIQKGLFQSFDRDSTTILKVLIQKIEPDFILCEGKSIYCKVKKLFNNEIEANWSLNCGFTTFEDGLTIIGFDRL